MAETLEKQIEEGASDAGGQEKDGQQEELDAIAGALEDEGINDDEEDEEDYDDDPYEGNGDCSD